MAVMKARKRTVDLQKASDFGCNPDDSGKDVSEARTVRYLTKPRRTAGVVVEGPAEDTVEGLVGFLQAEVKVV
jgi:hypothetical protein